MTGHRDDRPSVILAGGGSGGHIFPNLAVVERLGEMGLEVRAQLAVSQREIDSQIVRNAGLEYVPLPVRPLTRKPWEWAGWLSAWRKSVREMRLLITRYQVKAVVATGGFVSGPAIWAALKEGVPRALVNLDAVPGKANCYLAGKASKIFSAYAVADWPGAVKIDVPLRRAAIGPADSRQAKYELGLDPQRPLLWVCGGSQGAGTINKMMATLMSRVETAGDLKGWQVLHACGQEDQGMLEEAYNQAGVPARVMSFCARMDLAWSAADLAISRAGANSVAEAWANATPTIFLPYPFHRDEHQRFNAQPLVDSGGAMMYRDLVDPVGNAAQMAGPLKSLLSNGRWRVTMAQKLRENPPVDGALVVAQWLAETMG
ncbi:MAG: glycosyltransferase [Phycisphaeraceae bacterium]|nr:glycosyltransferase [Phycisphaeraceae bacterium]